MNSNVGQKQYKPLDSSNFFSRVGQMSSSGVSTPKYLSKMQMKTSPHLSPKKRHIKEEVLPKGQVIARLMSKKAYKDRKKPKSSSCFLSVKTSLFENSNDVPPVGYITPNFHYIDPSKKSARIKPNTRDITSCTKKLTPLEINEEEDNKSVVELPESAPPVLKTNTRVTTIPIAEKPKLFNESVYCDRFYDVSDANRPSSGGMINMKKVVGRPDKITVGCSAIYNVNYNSIRPVSSPARNFSQFTNRKDIFKPLTPLSDGIEKPSQKIPSLTLKKIVGRDVTTPKTKNETNLDVNRGEEYLKKRIRCCPKFEKLTQRNSEKLSSYFEPNDPEIDEYIRPKSASYQFSAKSTGKKQKIEDNSLDFSEIYNHKSFEKNLIRNFDSTPEKNPLAKNKNDEPYSERIYDIKENRTVSSPSFAKQYKHKDKVTTLNISYDWTQAFDKKGPATPTLDMKKVANTNMTFRSHATDLQYDPNYDSIRPHISTASLNISGRS
eukprot:TRINITY_DN2365_c0_g1_i1.p1 TRINITY_DN2365_c0_g1~~TRINITY_DN2365_c0_g1_i1.p1  ORF type:complete len:493 (+),score=125.17 TRINITY_DN2365_c0_g1_i1:56-1534(+)